MINIINWGNIISLATDYDRNQIYTQKMNMHEIYQGHSILSDWLQYYEKERVYKLCVSPEMPVSSS